MSEKRYDQTLRNVPDDEPIFVLRAQDELAPAAIDYWIKLAIARNVDREKVLEARCCAESMR